MRSRLLLLALAITALVPAPAGAEQADYVVPVPGPVVRHFEPPPTPYSAGHRGIDIQAPAGTTVVASASGIVRFAGAIGGELFVSIDHAWGTRSTYSYLSALLVRKGDSVSQGQAIARSGLGHAGSSPEHLHFGVIDSAGAYLDPEALIVASLRRNLWRVVWLAPVP